MPKENGSHNLSPDIRAHIFSQLKAGVSQAQLAEQFNCHIRTIQRIWRHGKDRGHHHDADRSGRPPKLDSKDIQCLERDITSNRRDPLATITENFIPANATSVSERTIRRAIGGHLGMDRCIAAHKPFLTPTHHQTRLNWANYRKSWKMTEWERVVWTDETSVELGKQSRQTMVWRKPGERYLESCLAPTFKSGRQSLMVWGCIAYGRVGPLVRMPKDERTGADYVRNILSGPLWDFYSELYEERGAMLVMEDGAPIHRSKVACNFRSSNFLETTDHPAQSPDLNPIEHVWHQLKVAVNKCSIRPKSLDELWGVLQEEWAKITVDYINTLIDSMPNRVRAVIEAKGGSTKY
jgi:transposase